MSREMDRWVDRERAGWVGGRKREGEGDRQRRQRNIKDYLAVSWVKPF